MPTTIKKNPKTINKTITLEINLNKYKCVEIKNEKKKNNKNIEE